MRDQSTLNSLFENNIVSIVYINIIIYLVGYLEYHFINYLEYTEGYLDLKFFFHMLITSTISLLYIIYSFHISIKYTNSYELISFVFVSSLILISVLTKIISFQFLYPQSMITHILLILSCLVLFVNQICIGYYVKVIRNQFQWYLFKNISPSSVKQNLYRNYLILNMLSKLFLIWFIGTYVTYLLFIDPIYSPMVEYTVNTALLFMNFGLTYIYLRYGKYERAFVSQLQLSGLTLLTLYSTFSTILTFIENKFAIDLDNSLLYAQAYIVISNLVLIGILAFFMKYSVKFQRNFGQGLKEILLDANEIKNENKYVQQRNSEDSNT